MQQENVHREILLNQHILFNGANLGLFFQSLNALPINAFLYASVLINNTANL